MALDDYWQKTVLLFEGTFAYYHDQPRLVVAQVHVEEEPYDLSEDGAAIHGVPTATSHGRRVYVHIWPSVVRTPLRLTATVNPADGQIGQVIGASWGEPRREKIGNVQGYYYAPVQTFTLYEAYLERHLRADQVDEDANMAALWRSLEAWARTAFPDCQQLTTPWRDPLFPPDRYQRFLEALGFAQMPGLAAFGKPL